MTLFLVSHDEDLARSCTDRIVRLQDGRLADGAPDRS
jgi:predicted ABC-type transport system involved in lysophospholipase L1 biosynthesis ATPase subunit